ncbi:MAG TPA: hypothetical protein VK970_13150, partial [Candidatus Methylacidiphilales bacterium]|nr:hypothetical protein [Candidatus Methylacidiphilales bacterium]
VMEHGKGFYSRLVYSIECRSLKCRFLSPDVNSPHYRFYPEPDGIRVPVKQIKGLTEAMLQRFMEERKKGTFPCIEDFFRRVGPNHDEMQNLLRAGAFDSLDSSRTSQFWAWRRCAQMHGTRDAGQDLLSFGVSGAAPESRTEPTYLERLKAETELLGFPVAGHPLDLHPDIAWDAYRPIAQMHEFTHKIIAVAGLIIEERLHHQVDGRMMKFISICDPTGIAEVEIFADVYSQYGLNTIRYPIVEIEARVLPLESQIGCTLEALAVRGPRTIPQG